MQLLDKSKEWIKENLPVLSQVYDNKYVGMLYDRFGSLPPKQQKQTIVGVFGFVCLIIVGYLLLSYWSLWLLHSRKEDAQTMTSLLNQYQKQKASRSSELSLLEKNSSLTGPGQFKQLLINQAKLSGISPRMIEVQEKGEGSDAAEDAKGSSEIKIRQATVTLLKVNLSQLKSYLQNIEFNQNNLGVSYLKVTNDDKVRGFMKVDLGIVAYLFNTEDIGG